MRTDLAVDNSAKIFTSQILARLRRLLDDVVERSRRRTPLRSANSTQSRLRKFRESASAQREEKSWFAYIFAKMNPETRMQSSRRTESFQRSENSLFNSSWMLESSRVAKDISRRSFTRRRWLSPVKVASLYPDWHFIMRSCKPVISKKECYVSGGVLINHPCNSKSFADFGNRILLN